MNKPYWRVSYNGIGIYESLKKEIWKKCENPKQEWEALKDSARFTWLNTPPFYNDNCYSYFTELGYKLFIKNTFPILVKYLDEKNIIVNKYIFDDTKLNLVHSDEHQVIIKQ